MFARSWRGASTGEERQGDHVNSATISPVAKTAARAHGNACRQRGEATAGRVSPTATSSRVLELPSSNSSRASPIALCERRPLDQLHHQGVRRPGVFEAVDVGDGRMVEGREHLRFPPEARQPVRIARKRIPAASSAPRRD